MRNLYKSPLKLGILGCGRFAQRRILPLLESLPTVKVVCVQKSNLAEAQEVALRFNIPRAVDTRNELLNHPEVEAVWITTPNHSHEADALACAQAHKPTLCEKPLAPTVAAIVRMIEAFHKSSTLLLVGQSLRFKPSIQKAKELLKSGELGSLCSLKAYFSVPVPESDWRHQKSHNGGVLQDIGVHLIDLIRFVSEEEITAVSAFAHPEYDISSSVADQTVSVICKLSSGTLASFECSFAHPFYASFEVIGTRSRLISTYSLRQGYESLETLCHIQENDSKIFLPISSTNIYACELQHFAEAVTHNIPSIIEAEEGLKNQRVIEAIFTSLRTQEKTKVE